MDLLVRKNKTRTPHPRQCGAGCVLLFDLLDTFCQQQVDIF